MGPRPGSRWQEDRGFFDNAAYAAEIREEVLTRESSIFAIAFCPERRYMLAGTNKGRLAIWDIKPHLFPSKKPVQDRYEPPFTPGCEPWRAPLSEGEAKSFPPHLVARKGVPLVAYQVSSRALNSIVFAGGGGPGGAVLLVGGDDGIFVWQWSSLRALLDEAKSGVCWKRQVQPARVLRGVGYSNRFPYMMESNQVSVDKHDPTRFYSAGGDSVVRWWDLGQLTGEGQKLVGGGGGHAGPVSSVSSVSSQCLVSGGEDGRVMLWDTRQAQPMVRAVEAWTGGRSGDGGVLSSSSMDASSSSSVSPANCKWVSAVEADSNGDWAVVGGGVEMPGQASRSERRFGYVSLLHVPSLQPVSACAVNAFVQDVRFNGADRITSVGVEPVITHWSRGTLECVGKASSRVLPSIFTIGLREPVGGSGGGMTCCYGGTSNRLDYFAYPETSTFTLTLR